MKKIFILSIILTGVFLLSSCSKEHRTMLRYAKKGTLLQKDTASMYFVNRKDYDKASVLLEELVPLSRTSTRGEDILYQLAMAKFKLEEYVMASYYFDLYARQYPNSKRAEEAAFTQSLAFYRQSDPYFLDQNYTIKAMEALQNFVDAYPKSEWVGQAEGYLTELRERKSRKSFEQAKLYAKTSNYKAAVSAIQTYVNEFPDSRYREEAEFLLVKSAVNLAQQSVDAKKINRYKDAIDFYHKFIDRYAKSSYRKEAEDLFELSRKQLTILEKGNS